MKELLNIRSFLIGLLGGILILFSVYMYIHGEEYRRVSNASPLSVREKVGVLPNGKELTRIIIPYKGRFHYVYVTEDSITVINRTINGKTTNNASEVYLK